MPEGIGLGPGLGAEDQEATLTGGHRPVVAGLEHPQVRVQDPGDSVDHLGLDVGAATVLHSLHHQGRQQGRDHRHFLPQQGDVARVVQVAVGAEDAPHRDFLHVAVVAAVAVGLPEAVGVIGPGVQVGAVEAFQGRQQLHRQQVQEAETRPGADVFLVVTAAAGVRGAEVQEEDGAVLLQHHLVAPHLLHPAQKGQAWHRRGLPSFWRPL